jgi:hypothetical protein
LISSDSSSSSSLSFDGFWACFVAFADSTLLFFGDGISSDSSYCGYYTFLAIGFLVAPSLGEGLGACFGDGLGACLGDVAAFVPLPFALTGGSSSESSSDSDFTCF